MSYSLGTANPPPPAFPLGPCVRLDNQQSKTWPELYDTRSLKKILQMCAGGTRYFSCNSGDLSLYSVDSSFGSICLVLLRVYWMGSRHAATVTTGISAVSWNSSYNNGKQSVLPNDWLLLTNLQVVYPQRLKSTPASHWQTHKSPVNCMFAERQIKRQFSVK